MAKTLVIAEKYLAACDMAEVLCCQEKKDGYMEGENYIITWADGHLIGFQYPEEYNPQYKEWRLEDLPLKFDPDKNLKILEGKERQFRIVRDLIQGTETDMIINAGDAGREGYLLQYWIYKMAENKKPVKVLWVSSLTPNALAEAFTNLHDESEFANILEEAKARSEIDYILGMNYSRLLTLKCSSDGVTLPYGRCMTTLLNLIVQRENEISEFESETSYSIEVCYKGGGKGTLVDPEGKEVIFEERDEAESILEEVSGEGQICSVKKKDTAEKAPLLYNLSDLQGLIGRKYKYSPAKTLEILQTLYSRHKIITYPRTDSNYLTSDLRPVIEKNLESCRFGKFGAALERCEKVAAPDQIYFNDEEVKDHHALIPSDHQHTRHIYGKLSQEEKNVFDEIVYSFLGIFCKERLKSSITLQVLIGGYFFRSTESTVKESGYKLLRKNEEPVEEKSDFFKAISELEDIDQKMTVDIQDFQIKEKNSNPPPRYTYGTITLLMKKHQIGTAATMAATVEKLMDKKKPLLIEKNGKYYPSHSNYRKRRAGRCFE